MANISCNSQIRRILSNVKCDFWSVTDAKKKQLYIEC